MKRATRCLLAPSEAILFGSAAAIALGRTDSHGARETGPVRDVALAGRGNLPEHDTLTARHHFFQRRCPMKAIVRGIACAALFTLAGSAARAQDEKVAPEKLPQKVKETLMARFPGAKIVVATKTKENNETVYDIEMTKDGKKHELDAREDGTIVNFENEIAVKDLPKAVADAVRAKHPDATITEAMETMVIKEGKDVVDEYEVLIVTADKKEVELTVSPDGKRIE
jgi:hypothetical protein